MKDNNTTEELNRRGFFAFNGKKYTLNLDALVKICLISDKQNTKEKEINEVYQLNDENEYELTQRVNRELKTNGNPQNDMIIYDVVKLFIIRLLENTSSEKEFEMDFSTALAFNTLLKCGILEEMN